MEDPQPESTEAKKAAPEESVGDSTSKEQLENLIKKAEDGSDEVDQLAVGLHFLKLAESGIEREKNGLEAMQWFIQSSRQGNELATSKIRHCLQTNLGITDENKEDVVWCLNTSAAEKKVRHASRKLFSVLNPGQSNLTQEQYLEAIDKLPVLDDRQRKLMTAAVKKVGSTVTENEFVKILSSKIQGTLTLTSSEVDDKSADYQSSSYVRKALVYPKQTASDLMDQGLEFASKKGMKLIMSFIPTGQIYVFISIFLYSFLTFSLVMLVVPLVTFYVSAAVMIIATLQMFYKKRKKKDSDNIATVLKQFDPGLDLQSTASQYSWNSLTPYLVFFASLFIMMISFSLSKKDYIPCAGLFIASIVMTFFCFYALSDTHDFITLAALLAHFFASLPVYLANFPKIPGLRYIYSSFFTLPLGSGFSLHISLPSIVYMIIPLLLIRMAMKDSWSGIYKIVIPHLVCYFWFSISTTVFPYTTWFDIIKAGIGYTLLPIMGPLMTVGTIIFLLYKLILTDVFGKLALMGVLLSIPLLLTKTELFLGEKGAKLSPTMEKVRKYAIIGFALLAVVPLLFIHTSIAPKPNVVEISWSDYKELCVPKEGDMHAGYQRRCRAFYGMKASWNGTLEQINIVDIENNVEAMVKSLPEFLSVPLRCFYGKPLPDCDAETMTSKEFKRCEILESAGRLCHINEYDVLSFSVVVNVDGVSVQLNAGSAFSSKLMALKRGDTIEFSGIVKTAGTLSPVLQMKSLNCSSRVLPVMMTVKVDDDILELLQEALAVTVNFVLFPIVTYTQEL